METEYLDVVNKELLEIQEFFQHYYNPYPSSSPSTTTSTLPPQFTLNILPLLNLPPTPTPTPPASPSNRGWPPPPPSHDALPDYEVDSVSEKDDYVTDLRNRYKQLKAVQDQMHLELTRSRIWKQSLLPEMTTTHSASASSFSSHKESSRQSEQQISSSPSPTPIHRPIMLRWASDSPPEPNSDPEPTATTTHADVALGAAERETDLLQRLKDVWHLGQRIYRATELFITSITPYIVVGMFLIAAFNDIARSATPRSLLFDPTPTEDNIVRSTMLPTPVFDPTTTEGNIVRSTTLPTPVFDPTTTEGNIVRSTTLPTPVYDPAPTKTTRYPWPRH